ncbi:MAG: hypothetical protein RL722_1172 [Pseudomonadota bacterium]|jgi:hypothetical protein
MSIMSASRAGLALAVSLLALAAMPARADFVTLSAADDEPVLRSCNPNNNARVDRCRVGSLPGLSGYTLVASRSSAIVRNEVTIGTLQDRVWRDRNGNHIFGMRLQMNSAVSDLTGLPYNVNDAFRQTLVDPAVAVAYLQAGREVAVAYAGRTVYGLNEEAPVEEEVVVDPAAPAEPPPPEGPVRDNGWVNFGINANAGEAAANSPWLLVKTRAPAGFSIQPFAIRLLSSDFADVSEFSEMFLAGYQPN